MEDHVITGWLFATESQKAKLVTKKSTTEGYYSPVPVSFLNLSGLLL